MALTVVTPQMFLPPYSLMGSNLIYHHPAATQKALAMQDHTVYQFRTPGHT